MDQHADKANGCDGGETRRRPGLSVNMRAGSAKTLALRGEKYSAGTPSESLLIIFSASLLMVGPFNIRILWCGLTVCRRSEYAFKPFMPTMSFVA